jgi:chromosomal replication initiator protein
MSLASYASNVWEMNENDRRKAFAARAKKGARKTLGMRDVIQVSSAAPCASEPVPAIVGIPEQAPTWRKILYQVAMKHGVSPSDITSVYKTKHIVAARYEAFYRMREELKISFPRIGMYLGRDHTTVLAGYRKHAARLAQEQTSLSPLSTLSTGGFSAR